MSTRVRWLQVTGGIACVALGAVGALVPLLPTTVFLLCGCYLLVRSAPDLERQVRGSRLFRPYLRYLDPSVPFPRRARVIAIASMWTSLGVSGAALLAAGLGATTVLATVLLTGAAGTCGILLFRRWPAGIQAS